MQDATLSANLEVRPTSAEFSDEVPNLVVDGVQQKSGEERLNSVREGIRWYHRGGFRGRGFAKGIKRKRTTVSRRTGRVNNSTISDRSTMVRKRNASANADETFEKRVAAGGRASTEVRYFYVTVICSQNRNFA